MLATLFNDQRIGEQLMIGQRQQIKSQVKALFVTWFAAVRPAGNASMVLPKKDDVVR